MSVHQGFPTATIARSTGAPRVKRSLLFSILFAYVFAPRLNSFVVIHAGYVGVAITLAAAVLYRQRLATSKSIVGTILFLLFLASYHSLMAVVYGNDPGYFVSICLSLSASMLFVWYFSSLVVRWGGPLDQLIDLLIAMSALAVFVNALIVLAEYFLPSFKALVESALYQAPGAGINYAEHPFRLRGLAAAGGAGLSVLNAMAVLLFTFLAQRKKVSGVVAILCASVVVASNVFIGRTGLIFSLLFFSFLVAMLVFRWSRSGMRGLVSLAAMICCAALVLQVSAKVRLDPQVARWSFEWLDGNDAGLESSSVEDLKSMLYVPQNPVHLLFGVGFFEGDDQIYPRTDSGYLKTMLAIGVVCGALLYALLAFLFSGLTQVSTNYRWLVASVLAFMFLVEVKEPFLYQNFAARVMILLSGGASYVLYHRRA